MSKVSENVTATTSIIAHYKPSNEDTDGDGVMDWFELYQFGNLNQSGSDDPDGDGFSNQREGELGQEATIFDNVEWGGYPAGCPLVFFTTSNKTARPMTWN